MASPKGNAAKLVGKDLRPKLMSLLGTGPSAVLRLEGATLIVDEAGAQRRLDLTALPANRNGDVAIGVGEPAVIATAPAILNAIYQATGVRVRFLPATPDRLRKAIVSAATST